MEGVGLGSIDKDAVWCHVAIDVDRVLDGIVVECHDVAHGEHGWRFIDRNDEILCLGKIPDIAVFARPFHEGGTASAAEGEDELSIFEAEAWLEGCNGIAFNLDVVDIAHEGFGFHDDVVACLNVLATQFDNWLHVLRSVLGPCGARLALDADGFCLDAVVSGGGIDVDDDTGTETEVESFCQKNGADSGFATRTNDGSILGT